MAMGFGGGGGSWGTLEMMVDLGFGVPAGAVVAMTPLGYIFPQLPVEAHAALVGGVAPWVTGVVLNKVRNVKTPRFQFRPKAAIGGAISSVILLMRLR